MPYYGHSYRCGGAGAYVHKLLHLLPLHAVLQLALLRSCQSATKLARQDKGEQEIAY